METGYQGLTGRLVTSADPGYGQARLTFNARFSKFPRAIVYCQVAQDAVNAVRWAAKHGVPFRVRCGGHSYEAFSVLDGGLVIDVSELLQLRYDAAAGTARVGAGYRLLPLYEALWKKGVALPAGTCPTVGVSGLTLGGGFGVLSRLWGMTCDNVVEVEMVNARGTLIRARSGQHNDLFWACRGGGDGSYGIITAFTFRVHPIGSVATYAMRWNFDDLRRVVKYWQSWAPRTDNRLTSLLNLPASVQGSVLATGVFVGPQSELRQLLQPVQETLKPKTFNIRTSSWIETARRLAAGTPPRAKFKNTSAYAYEPLSDEALDVLDAYLRSAPGDSSLVAFDAYGGAVGAVAPDATAFVHRNALFVLQYQSYWEQDADAAKNIRWIDQFRKAMLPYTRGAFRDYCDEAIPDWPDAYFGANLAKLKQVKRVYDPGNLFRFEQSIPLA